MIISHIKQLDDGNWIFQTNDDHQNGVAQLASSFASEFGMGEWGRVLGLLHDKGKEQKTFQQHIQKDSGYNPTIKVVGDYNHAYVGSLIAKQLFNKPPYYQFIDNILMGHHRGLYDDGDRRLMLEKGIPCDVSVEKIDTILNMPPCQSPKDIHHLIRMLFSCLVDADRLDTEKFMNPEQYSLRGSHASMEALLKKLETYLQDLKSKDPESKVNKIRNEVQEYCIKESEGDVGFYSLTVPTGGGKTLSSVLWALKHAVKNNLNRIIIAIPYTSIITQTAAVLRTIFGEENVLEHHSMVETEDKESSVSTKHKLATENWDYPIIVTTNVQLFESLFSNKPSDCRKLHNIVKSVLILDEVQTLPIDFLEPIIDTFKTLKSIFGVSILFTTASQPILNGKIEGSIKSFMALPEVKEIIPLKANLHDRLRRVELFFDKEISTYDDIAKRISRHNIVLCIVNTRKDASEIYNRLPKEGITLHLSRMMCPAHVRETIEHIKQALKSKEPIVRVVSTQLIEAGVDIDFPVVYRQEAGLDSVLQAAGRCNREGKLCGMGVTYVFKLDKPLPPGMMSMTNNARKNMVGEYDWFSPLAMHNYFSQLYSRVEGFDKKQIGIMLYKQDMQFEEASNQFQLIDDNTKSVIINWKDGKKYIQKLENKDFSYNLIKQLSQYSVNIRKNDFNKLYSSGAINEVMEGFYTISSSQFYDNNIGLTVSNHWLEEIHIV